jgi:ABC-type transporter Mla subunit MlaD
MEQYIELTRRIERKKNSTIKRLLETIEQKHGTVDPVIRKAILDNINDMVRFFYIAFPNDVEK